MLVRFSIVSEIDGWIPGLRTLLDSARIRIVEKPGLDPLGRFDNKRTNGRRLTSPSVREDIL